MNGFLKDPVFVYVNIIVGISLIAVLRTQKETLVSDSCRLPASQVTCQNNKRGGRNESLSLLE